MTSRDVLHSFYVPDFRIKQDVLPGRYTETWFEATKPGRYQILCAEYCGTWHSQMWGEVVVMPGPEFDSWMVEQKAGLAERVDTGGDDGGSMRGSIVEYGKKIAMSEGCLRCHSLDGQPHIGPTWLDLYQRRETLENGEAVIADEAYLTDSMIDPRGKVVKGFKPVMPTYKGRLAAPEAAALVEFIKSLRSTSLENLPSKEATYEPAKPSQPATISRRVYPAVNYLNADRGVRSWLLTLDHKRIAVMYFASVLVMFLVGGIFAMAVRLELLTPEPTIMGANTYNRDVHAARRGHDLPLHDPGDPRHLRQLLHAADAGREGRRVPEAEPAVAVPVLDGRHPGRSARW